MKYLTKVAMVGIIAGATIGMTEKAFASETVIQDFYKTVTKNIPSTEQVCETKRVPIYGEGKFDQDGAILGGIVGGIIGNQIGKGSGKEAATGVGAMIGAIQGGKGNREIIGYQDVNQCYNKTSYTTETNEVYDYSTVTFYDNGKRYIVKFRK